MPSLAEYQRELRTRKGKREALLAEIAELIGRSEEKKADRRRGCLAKLEGEIEWLEGKVRKGSRPGYREAIQNGLKKLSKRLESIGEPCEQDGERWNASEIRVEMARLKAGVAQTAKIVEELRPLWSENEGALIPKTVGKVLSLALKARVAAHEKTMAVLQERLKDAAEREELSQLPVSELQALKEKEELISRILEERAKRRPKEPGPTASERMLQERGRLMKERETVIDEITGGRPREEWDEETEAHVMKVRNYYDDLIDAALGG